jgi:O-antigen ligase
MEALSLEHNNIANRKLLFLLVSLQLLIISSSLLFHYISGFILLAGLSFLFLNFSDVRITLWFLIAFSILVAYARGMVTAVMMVVLGSACLFVCLSVFLKFCLGEFKIKKTKLNLPVAVFLIMSSLQALRGIFSSYPTKWLLIEILAYLGFGLVFLVINLYDRKEIIKKSFQLLILVAYYQAIIGLWNYFQVEHRIGGYLFGAFPSLVALVLFNLSFYSKEKSKKLTYLLMSLPLVMHLLFSFTRGLWFGFLAGLLFSYSIYLAGLEYSVWTKVRRLLKGMLAFILIIFVLTVGIQGFLLHENLLGQFGGRFLSSFSTKLSSSTFSNVTRLLEYGIALEKIKSKPIFGYGVGYKLSFTDPILRERIRSGIVHQFYLMIILKMGLIGLLVFLWIFYVFFKEGLKESKKIENGYYKGLCYGFMANSIELLVISFTNHPFATVDNNFYLAFTMAGVMVIISRRN